MSAPTVPSPSTDLVLNPASAMGGGPGPDQAARSRNQHVRTGNNPTRPPASFWKSLALHMLIPFFLAAGMGLAYLGAFHQPVPSHVQIAVVGESPASQVFAEQINNKAGGKLDVRTVADAATAKQLVSERKIDAAYLAGAHDATLYVSTAASDSTATIVESVFLPIAYSQHLPLQIDDVVAPSPGDPTGEGLFFLLVALSVGGYSSAIAIAGATAKVGLKWRLLISVAAAAIVSAIGIIVAGPIYHVIDHSQWSMWLLAWLYDLTIILVGVGLHPLLRHWTTPALTLLFVMLNFTSSGGIFAASTVPPFFAALGSFWNGAAWLHASQTLAYFPGQDFWFDGLKLGLWVAVGLLLVLLTHSWSVRRYRLANEQVEVTEEEEAVAA